MSTRRTKRELTNILQTSGETANTRKVARLRNYNNTCFISSLVWALSGILYRDVTFFRSNGDNSQFITLMDNFLMNSEDPKFTDISYKPFVDYVRKLPDFRHGQHDPSELLTAIMNGDNNFDKLNVVNQNINYCHSGDIVEAYSRPIVNREENKTLFLPIIDPSISTKLPIPLSYLIYNGILKHSNMNARWEMVQGKYCPNTKSYSTKIYHSISDVIVLITGRYNYTDIKDGKASKIETPLDVPLSMDFGQFLVNPESKVYDLISVIYHDGSFSVDEDRGGFKSFGHYTAHINNRTDWYYCDDITGVRKESNIIELQKRIASGYIYIYMRQNTKKMTEAAKYDTDTIKTQRTLK